MTTRQNVRAITDGLGSEEWIRIDAIRAALPEPKPPQKSLLSAVNKMVRRHELLRRGEKRAYEYRSGGPLIDKPRVKPKPAVRLGFMALARLRDSDPAAYQRAVVQEEAP